MKIKMLMGAVALVTLVSVPAFSQSDTTTTILQGLQKLNSGTGGAGSAQGVGGMTFDKAKAAAIARASMTAIDTDRSGAVSRDELAVLTNKFFDVADANGDTQLSEDELSTFAANMNQVMMFLR